MIYTNWQIDEIGVFDMHCNGFVLSWVKQIELIKCLTLTILCLWVRLCSPPYTVVECTDIDKHSGCLLLLS